MSLLALRTRPGDVEPVADDGGVDVDVDRARPGDDGATLVVAA